MKKKSLMFCFISGGALLMLTQCSQPSNENQTAKTEAPKENYGGFESQVKWGEHLVTIAGCNDCHTPKKMTDHGPDIDSSLMLSGHPSNMPAPDVNRKEMESKGLVVTSTLTEWVGPWGVSFTANLTSDPTTGIGNWPEENFIRALREGKYKGIAASRPLLPPMPWPSYKHMTDDELSAIFAYLKSTKPIRNAVPEPLPPVSAPPKAPAK